MIEGYVGLEKYDSYVSALGKGNRDSKCVGLYLKLEMSLRHRAW